MLHIVCKRQGYVFSRPSLNEVLLKHHEKEPLQTPNRASTEALCLFYRHLNKCRNQHLFALYCWNCAGNIIT